MSILDELLSSDMKRLKESLEDMKRSFEAAKKLAVDARDAKVRVCERLEASNQLSLERMAMINRLRAQLRALGAEPCV